MCLGLNDYEPIKKLGNIFGAILNDWECDVQTADSFLGLLISLNDKNVPIFPDKELLSGVKKVITRFKEDREFCLKAMNTISSIALPEESKRRKSLNLFILILIHLTSDEYYEVGLIGTVKRVLNTYISDPSICEHGCQALEEMLQKTDGKYSFTLSNHYKCVSFLR